MMQINAGSDGLQGRREMFPLGGKRRDASAAGDPGSPPEKKRSSKLFSKFTNKKASATGDINKNCN